MLSLAVIVYIIDVVKKKSFVQLEKELDNFFCICRITEHVLIYVSTE